MKQAFIEKRFQSGTLKIIEQANTILNDNAAKGYTLTLRQLYYQFVAKGLIPNNDKEYDRLGSIVNDARLAGYIDWRLMEDRTRNLKANYHEVSPDQAIQGLLDYYRLDLWKDQPNYVEVWVEKEALAGIVGRVAEEEDVSYFSCRGYVSQSEQYGAGAGRFARMKYREKREPVVIHLGDHDPSGIDMTRDIRDRLEMFAGFPVEVNRIALNMNQIQAFNPPPNPAKLSDSRCAGYIDRFGYESWELDAMEADTMAELIREAIRSYRDDALYRNRKAQEQTDREYLENVVGRWEDIKDFLAQE